MNMLEIHGHRGSRGTHPENTLLALDAGRAAGADVLELDVGLTRDRVVVVHHDESLNVDLTRLRGRWIDEPIALADLTYAELERYDVGRSRPGSAYAQRFPHQKPDDGIRIPTLDAALALGCPLNIELKVSPEWSLDRVRTFVELVVDRIVENEAVCRTRVMSFDWRVLDEMNRLATDLPRSCLTSTDTTFAPGRRWTTPWLVSDFGGSVVRMACAAGCDTWSPNYVDLTEENVRDAHEVGLRVIPWTVNDKAELLRVSSMVVDGVITDYPRRAVELLRDIYR